jgi:hypothetical protein
MEPMKNGKYFRVVTRSVLISLLFFLGAAGAEAQTAPAKEGKLAKVRLHIDGFNKSKSGAI